MPHTLLRANAYLQNTFFLIPEIAATSGFACSAGAGRIGMVDTRDVAAVAAEVAGHPADHAGRTYWLSGPELITYAQVAAVLSQRLGRTVTFRASPGYAGTIAGSSGSGAGGGGGEPGGGVPADRPPTPGRGSSRT